MYLSFNVISCLSLCLDFSKMDDYNKKLKSRDLSSVKVPSVRVFTEQQKLKQGVYPKKYLCTVMFKIINSLFFWKLFFLFF